MKSLKLIINLLIIAIATSSQAIAQSEEQVASPVAIVISERLVNNVNQGTPLASSIAQVLEMLTNKVDLQKNNELVQDVYAGVLLMLNKIGAGSESEIYREAIATTSKLIIDTYGVSEVVIVEAALAANVDVGTIIDTLPATAAGPAQKEAAVAQKSTVKGIITSNTASSGGSPASPAS